MRDSVAVQFIFVLLNHFFSTVLAEADEFSYSLVEVALLISLRSSSDPILFSHNILSISIKFPVSSSGNFFIAVHSDIWTRPPSYCRILHLFFSFSKLTLIFNWFVLGCFLLKVTAVSPLSQGSLSGIPALLLCSWAFCFQHTGHRFMIGFALQWLPNFIALFLVSLVRPVYFSWDQYTCWSGLCYHVEWSKFFQTSTGFSGTFIQISVDSA